MVRVLACVLVVAACGGGGDNHDVDASVVVDAGPVSSCDPPGHFGAPEAGHTFTLVPQGSQLAFEDVQAAFPAVDWQTLDRLYIPAGHYTNIHLGNLPVRDAARPLVITNQGGQVVVGFNPHGNYIWSFVGGANWVLTGRYDPDSQTGDAAFAGHACGHYADSAGTYGIISDDDYAFDAPYLHMGIGVSSATDFEIEYVEVARSGFAGIRLLNPTDTLGKPMANVRVHDVYIHDTGAEGFYFGWTGAPPSNIFTGLQIYNTRILRTGNEALQIQDLGGGTHVHHNTFIGGGLHWLDNGLGSYQDNLAQISTREGAIELDHNVFVDGAGTLASFWSNPQTGDGDRHVSFHDNYFANTLSLGFYLGGPSASGSDFAFANNTFRGSVFGYKPANPAATDPGVVLSPGGDFHAPIALTGNHWQGGDKLISGITGGDGTAGAITASGNVNDDPPALALVDAGALWDRPGHHLTAWAPNATVVSGSPAVTYHAGDVVTHGEAPDFYECTADTTSEPGAGGAWTQLARPADDVRVAPGSPYAGYGVQ